jgi:hypothetical protein
MSLFPSKKVIGKEKRFIPREKIMTQIKDAEREKEKTTKTKKGGQARF